MQNASLSRKDFCFSQLREGAVFVYPTDTIYGIGCDATNERAVAHVRDLKSRDSKPFSIIAPSKKWIVENCKITPLAKQWLKKLPGPYTLILSLKDKNTLSSQINDSSSAVRPQSSTVGVRIPKHWISGLVRELGKPVVTTSVNKSGSPALSAKQDILSFGADFVLFEGPKNNKASTVVDVTGKEENILRK